MRIIDARNELQVISVAYFTVARLRQRAQEKRHPPNHIFLARVQQPNQISIRYSSCSYTVGWIHLVAGTHTCENVEILHTMTCPCRERYRGHWYAASSNASNQASNGRSSITQPDQTCTQSFTPSAKLIHMPWLQYCSIQQNHHWAATY